MKEQRDSGQLQKFTSLTVMMERFALVPYEQFQQELHAWFCASLSEKGIDLQQLQQSGLANLPELVSAIYHEAELKQLLKDQSISDDHCNDQV